PKRMAGKNGDWKPVQPKMVNSCQICGLMTTANPARMAPAGRRMPKSTTVASHSRPASAGVLLGDAERLNEASMTPPRPAMAAEMAKSLSLVMAGETPAVAEAGSLDRTATMARPFGDRRTFQITTQT